MDLISSADNLNEQNVRRLTVSEESRSQIAIYEVFRVVEGKPKFLNEHLLRLRNSAEILGITLWLSDQEIENRVKALIQQHSTDTGNVKLVFASEIANYILAESFSAFFIAHNYPTPEQYTKGVPTVLLHSERKTPNAKVFQSNLREQADNAIKQHNAYEAILVNTEGFITEGSKSNIFFVKGEAVFTSPLENVLPGVTRQKMVELCTTNHIILHEKAVSTNELASFDAAFITGTSPQVLPISNIENICFDVNNFILRKLMQLFNLKAE